jgi:hypothetical protein
MSYKRFRELENKYIKQNISKIQVIKVNDHLHYISIIVLLFIRYFTDVLSLTNLSILSWKPNI